MTVPLRKTVHWSKGALEDLEAIVEHIARRDWRAAERLSNGIFKKAGLLGHFPSLGTRCPFYRQARFFVHRNHVIYYTVHAKEVVIRAVVRGARLFQRSWFRRD